MSPYEQKVGATAIAATDGRHVDATTWGGNDVRQSSGLSTFDPPGDEDSEDHPSFQVDQTIMPFTGALTGQKLEFKKLPLVGSAGDDRPKADSTEPIFLPTLNQAVDFHGVEK